MFETEVRCTGRALGWCYRPTRVLERIDDEREATEARRGARSTIESETMALAEGERCWTALGDAADEGSEVGAPGANVRVRYPERRRPWYRSERRATASTRGRVERNETREFRRRERER